MKSKTAISLQQTTIKQKKTNIIFSLEYSNASFENEILGKVELIEGTLKNMEEFGSQCCSSYDNTSRKNRKF